MAGDAAGRLRGGALRALLAGNRLRPLFRGPHHPGGKGGVEQLPCDADRLRGGPRGGGSSMSSNGGGGMLMEAAACGAASPRTGETATVACPAGGGCQQARGTRL